MARARLEWRLAALAGAAHESAADIEKHDRATFPDKEICHIFKLTGGKMGSNAGEAYTGFHCHLGFLINRGDKMSLFARDAEVLRVFNDLLHDLYFEIPRSGFVARDKRVEIELWDRDHVIDKERTNRFKLTVHNVVDLKNMLSNANYMSTIVMKASGGKLDSPVSPLELPEEDGVKMSLRCMPKSGLFLQMSKRRLPPDAFSLSKT